MFFQARNGLLRKHRSAKSAWELRVSAARSAHAGFSTGMASSLLGIKTKTPAVQTCAQQEFRAIGETDGIFILSLLSRIHG